MKLTEYIDLVDDLAAAVLNEENGASTSRLAQTVKAAGRQLRAEPDEQPGTAQ